MEHPWGVTGLTPGVTPWTKESISRLHPDERQALTALIDEAGVRSGRAQGLPCAITSVVRLPRLPFASCFRAPERNRRRSPIADRRDPRRATRDPRPDAKV
jgi:hypothetical protein